MSTMKDLKAREDFAVRDAPPIADPLARAAEQYVVGVANLREENFQLAEQVECLQRDNAVLQAENVTLRGALNSEKSERAYYQRFSVEVATSLGLVAQVCGDVIDKAQQQAYRKNGAAPPSEALPEIEVPEFLRTPPGEGNGAAGAPSG
jgi:hypothetical protein